MYPHNSIAGLPLFLLVLLLEKLLPLIPPTPHLCPTTTLFSFRSQFKHHLLTQALPAHLARELASHCLILHFLQNTSQFLKLPYPFFVCLFAYCAVLSLTVFLHQSISTLRAGPYISLFLCLQSPAHGGCSRNICVLSNWLTEFSF